ncbi:MAG: GTPase [Nodosilinea sp.]
MTPKEIEKRLENIAKLHEKLDQLINELPIELPPQVLDLIKSTIFNNKDIAELIDGIKNRRPPRFVLVGRTGVGKSSLINALCGQYLAKVSDVERGTLDAGRFTYKSGGRTVFEVVDTRGIAESENDAEKNDTAENNLSKVLEDFNPDAVLFLTRCKERAYLDQDVLLLKSIAKNSSLTFQSLLC